MITPEIDTEIRELLVTAQLAAWETKDWDPNIERLSNSAMRLAELLKLVYDELREERVATERLKPMRDLPLDGTPVLARYAPAWHRGEWRVVSRGGTSTDARGNPWIFVDDCFEPASKFVGFLDLPK